MVDQYAGPSVNPANLGSLTGLLRLIMEKQLQNTDDMLPAQIVAYNPATNTAQVQPLIYVITTDNRRIKRAPVASVPVLQLGGGGFLIRFPIKAGDLGWIKANDRDISNFKASMANAVPQTYRKHTFEDSMFIPDVMMKGVSLADEDGVCIQSLNGEVSIVLLDNEIKINATERISLNADEILINGIGFDEHVHTDVDPGAGESGPPVNP